VPVHHYLDAAQGCKTAGAYAHIQKGTGHGIAPDGLQAALAFMRERLSVA
jgi:phospholipase/carboxylesterase